MILTLEEIKHYTRIDTDEDDALLQGFLVAGEEYLRNATGKTYPEEDANGNKMNYELEKIFLSLLISYWYEERTPIGKTAMQINPMTKALLLQLQLRKE